MSAAASDRVSREKTGDARVLDTSGGTCIHNVVCVWGGVFVGPLSSSTALADTIMRTPCRCQQRTTALSWQQSWQQQGTAESGSIVLPPQSPGPLSMYRAVFIHTCVQCKGPWTECYWTTYTRVPCGDMARLRGEYGGSGYASISLGWSGTSGMFSRPPSLEYASMLPHTCHERSVCICKGQRWFVPCKANRSARMLDSGDGTCRCFHVGG